jgi:dipeptidyl-peptidase 4
MISARSVSLLVASVLVMAPATSAQAQQKTLTVDAIYDPVTHVDFSGSPPTHLEWIDDSNYLWLRQAVGGHEYLEVNAATGTISPLFDVGRMETALANIPGVTRADAAAVIRSDDLILNAQYTAAVVTIANDLYFYDFAGAHAARLTSDSINEEEVSFSPDGEFVAFVRNNNLFVVDVRTQRERALTTDGSADLRNGKLDWLYQEEIFGRGKFRGYWWSPDSSRIGFLQLNETPVPRFTIVDHIPYRPSIEVELYPKAGDPNPTVKLAIARAVGGDLTWVDLTAYAPVDFLIVDVAWAPDSRHISYQVQNREQTWLDLNSADPGDGTSKTLFRETTKAWVSENGSPQWLTDGSFLWLSDRSGFTHLYHYHADGSLVRQITSGRWEVRHFYGVDAKSGSIYFSGTEHSPLGVDIYQIEVDGTGLTRLSNQEGTHAATFNRALTQYIDVWSTVTTPPQVRLHGNDGSEVRVIDANPVKALAEYKLAKPEFLQVKTRDGFVMDALMIKPPDFNPSRRYPVFQHTYGGPGAPQVKNAWGGPAYMFHQMLAQNGIIVWICDNRSASGKGSESQWPIYGNLGELELQDIEDGVAWLKEQRYVDGSRIVLEGWSYGGFMTAYALTHSTSFAGGIVGAPVVDWRDYDTVYTERYMRMPQNNPDGYKKSAPRYAAHNLHGRLLLLHGTVDDNVHMQNSIQFAYALQNSRKPFEMMIYARQRHGFTDEHLITHLRQTMFDFIVRTIGGPAETRSPTPDLPKRH